MERRTTIGCRGVRMGVVLIAAALLACCGGGDNGDEGKVQLTSRPALATAPKPETRPASTAAAETGPAPATEASATRAAAQGGKPVTLPDGLIIQDITTGTGPVVTPGQTITVNYTGTLDNGTVFDSTTKSGSPASFVIGRGAVIAGWDEGIPGMHVGGKRKLTIPAALGYGATGMPGGPGRPGIPPNATLHFEVEVLSAK